MKTAIFYKIAIASAIIIICFLLYYFHDSFNLGHFKMARYNNINEKYLNPLRHNKVVITKFHLGLGEFDSIGIEFATPYKNKKEMTQFLKNKVMIKSDFLMDVGEKELKKWVKTRNFGAIKSKFLQIVNNHVDQPVEKVYLSRFFYE